MDETPNSTSTETAATTPTAQTTVVDVPAANAPDTPQLAPTTDARKLGRTLEIVKTDPGAQRVIASELGLITADEVNQIRLTDARDAAIEAYSIPADKQKFVVGSTPAEIRQSAKELADLLKPAATPATTETEPTSQPAATTRVELPERKAETPSNFTSKGEAKSAYAAWADKNIGK